MTTTFNGIAFGIQTSDFVPYPINQETFSTVHHVPYSDVNVLDYGGKGEKRLTATVRVGYAYISAFTTTWLGQTYALVVNSVSLGSALLIKAQNVRYDPGLHYALIDVEWVLAA
jgi:hypothetical protein